MRHTMQAGVTLIEMLVVVAIIALVSSVLLFNYSDFTTNVSVRNLSQEIALTVRKAQTYATSVRTIDGTTMDSSTFPGYGISFATTNPSGDSLPGPHRFVLFADTDAIRTSTSIYNTDADAGCGNASVGNGNECLETFTISTADRIESICNGTICYDSSKDAKIDITFRRPSPDAIICLSTGGTPNCNISYAVINLVSAKNLRRSVEIWNTGQISVK